MARATRLRSQDAKSLVGQALCNIGEIQRIALRRRQQNHRFAAVPIVIDQDVDPCIAMRQQLSCHGIN